MLPELRTISRFLAFLGLQPNYFLDLCSIACLKNHDSDHRKLVVLLRTMFPVLISMLSGHWVYKFNEIYIIFFFFEILESEIINKILSLMRGVSLLKMKKNKPISIIYSSPSRFFYSVRSNQLILLKKISLKSTNSINSCVTNNF